MKEIIMRNRMHAWVRGGVCFAAYSKRISRISLD